MLCDTRMLLAVFENRVCSAVLRLAQIADTLSCSVRWQDRWRCPCCRAEFSLYCSPEGHCFKVTMLATDGDLHLGCQVNNNVQRAASLMHDNVKSRKQLHSCLLLLRPNLHLGLQQSVGSKRFRNMGRTSVETTNMIASHACSCMKR